MLQVTEPKVCKRRGDLRREVGARGDSAPLATPRPAAHVPRSPGAAASSGSREALDSNWRSDVGRSSAVGRGPRAPGPPHSVNLPRGGRQPNPAAHLVPRGDTSARRPLSRPPWSSNAPPAKQPPPAREQVLGNRTPVPPPPPAHRLPPPPPPSPGSSQSPKRTPPSRTSPYSRPGASGNGSRGSADIENANDVDMDGSPEYVVDAWGRPYR